MTCLRPLEMYDTHKLTANGKKSYVMKRPPWPVVDSVLVPCGKCPACRENRRNLWCTRMRAELFARDRATFVTLTYDEENVPRYLQKPDLQNFFRRLRNVPRDYDIPLPKISYFACGEYGKKKHRPHYHAVVFGVDMLSLDWQPELVSWKDGHPVYCSRLLGKVWTYGYNVVGSVTNDSIRYVAKYVAKDVAESCAVPEFYLASIGLGRSMFVEATRRGRQWDYRFSPQFEQAYKNGFTVLPNSGIRDCSKIGTPKFLDRLAERFYPDMFAESRARRKEYASRSTDMRSPSVRERYINHQRTELLKKGVLDNET